MIAHSVPGACSDRGKEATKTKSCPKWALSPVSKPAQRQTRCHMLCLKQLRCRDKILGTSRRLWGTLLGSGNLREYTTESESQRMIGQNLAKKWEFKRGEINGVVEKEHKIKPAWKKERVSPQDWICIWKRWGKENKEPTCCKRKLRLQNQEAWDF